MKKVLKQGEDSGNFDSKIPTLFWLTSYMTDCSQNKDLRYNRITMFDYLHLV